MHQYCMLTENHGIERVNAIKILDCTKKLLDPHYDTLMSSLKRNYLKVPKYKLDKTYKMLLLIG